MIIPGEAFTKTGYPVREVLQRNHPPLHEIDTVYPTNSTFDLYQEFLDAVTLDISFSDVEFVAYHIGGTGGQGGSDAMVLKEWYTHFSSYS